MVDVSRTAAALVVSLTLAVASTGCGPSSSSDDGRSPVESGVAEPAKVPADWSVPQVVLSAQLRAFLVDAAAGRPVAGRLAGDRLLVLTVSTFSELPRTSFTGDARNTALSLGFNCDGVCTRRFGDLVDVLYDDLTVGVPVDPPSSASESLSNWPALTFRSGERTWRVAFDDSGMRLVAVELFGALPPSP